MNNPGDKIRVVRTTYGTKVFVNNALLTGLQDFQVNQAVDQYSAHAPTLVTIVLAANSVVIEDIPDFVVEEEA